MPVKVEALVRKFQFNGLDLPDPNPSLTLEQVRDVYVNTYPELATAGVEGPVEMNGTLKYTFTRAIGAKG